MPSKKKKLINIKKNNKILTQKISEDNLSIKVRSKENLDLDLSLTSDLELLINNKVKLLINDSTIEIIKNNEKILTINV